VSTAAVAIGDRLAYWEDYNADALVGLTCTTYQPDGLLARQRNLSLDAFRLADIAGNPHAIERAPGMVRSRPKDATFVSMMIEGDAFFYHSGGCLLLRPGDTVVYDTDQPYLFGFGTTMRQLLLDVPRPVFAQRCERPVSHGPVLVPGDDPGVPGTSARALRRVLLELVADPSAAPDAAGEQVLDLVQTMRTGRGSSSSTAHLLAAKAFIAAHLGDPGLSVDVVARAVGVTSRHLNRAFAAEPTTTVTQYILARRLERARADLTSPQLAHFRVADIAFRWGFSSQAHFSRLFRARFGCSPSQARTAAGFP
jgi:AraC-like DNA-binding protein